MNDILELKKAPEFSLLGSDNNTHSINDFLGKNIVLYFYPKDNTPGCTNEAINFRDSKEALDELNTVIIGISKDSVKSHERFIEKQGLNFLILADEDKSVCQLYDVLKEKNMYGKKTIGIERSTFIMNKDGYIVKEFRKVKVPGHVDEVVNFIKENLI
ncbi:thioredoxin-dependent thiol peroxidase [Clostridium sp. UBA1056]|uniref:thioredoxin-dependent thiol peroxidase n=1 Tax=unclassified Clostridium TaxID=2614128 RepID=UPI003216B236